MEKPRIFIDEGQEFVIGDNVFKWEYIDPVLRTGILLSGVTIPKPAFSVSEVKIKKSRRKKCTIPTK